MESFVTLVRLALERTMTAAIALLALTIVVAGIPPALDEDRTEPGFCSPDCPLQQDATHSDATSPARAFRSVPAELAREELKAVATPVYTAVPPSPDAPRAPPHT